MEAVGYLLYYGLGVQILCVILGAGVLLARCRIVAQVWCGILLTISSVAAFFGGAMPALQLFYRIGISHLASCWSLEECRSDVIFCVTWLAAVMLLLSVLVVLCIASRQKQPS